MPNLPLGPSSSANLSNNARFLPTLSDKQSSPRFRAFLIISVNCSSRSSSCRRPPAAEFVEQADKHQAAPGPASYRAGAGGPSCRGPLRSLIWPGSNVRLMTLLTRNDIYLIDWHDRSYSVLRSDQILPQITVRVRYASVAPRCQDPLSDALFEATCQLAPDARILQNTLSRSGLPCK